MDKSIFSFTITDIEGTEQSLKQYMGKVLLIVNVASKCGHTPQYTGLQKIYEKYKEKGFVILGFPANDFLGQEPGTNEEIKEFCTLNYKVTFPLFSKMTVKGSNIHPFYEFLVEESSNPDYFGKVKWNFTKFLIDRNGKIVDRFEPKEKPEDERVIKRIEKELL